MGSSNDGTLIFSNLFEHLLQIPFFFIIRKLGWLRASASQEFMGLDLAFHGASAFPKDASDSPKADHEAPLIEDTAHYSFFPELCT